MGSGRNTMKMSRAVTRRRRGRRHAADHVFLWWTRGSISIIAEGEKHEKNTIADFSYGGCRRARVDRLQK